jgi:proteic killer suppression protein
MAPSRVQIGDCVAIKTWACEHTRAIFDGESPDLVPRNLLKRANAKLLVLHAAVAFRDLMMPPGNRLEKLRDDRKGQHSIRINDQYRVCFVWRNGDAYDVEIVDYH